MLVKSNFLRNVATIIACLAVTAIFSGCDSDDENGNNTVAVTDVSVFPQTLTLAVGAKQTLTAIVAPEEATNATVTWTSSNAAAATVNATTGEVTAVAADKGTATITATAGGKSDACVVTVSSMKTNAEIMSYFQDDFMFEWKETRPDWDDKTYFTEMELSCAEGYIYIQDSDGASTDPKNYRYVVDYINYAQNIHITLRPNNPQAYMIGGNVPTYFHGEATRRDGSVKALVQFVLGGVLVGFPYSQGKIAGTATMLGRPVTHYTYSYNMDNIQGEFWLDDATGAVMKMIEKEGGQIVRTRETLKIKVGGVKLIDGLDISQYNIRPVQN